MCLRKKTRIALAEDIPKTINNGGSKFPIGSTCVVLLEDTLLTSAARSASGKISTIDDDGAVILDSASASSMLLFESLFTLEERLRGSPQCKQ